MRIIQLTQGATAIVSDEDYDRLSHYRYKLIKDGNRRYAYREEGGSLIGLHQDILGDRPGLVIDHVNRDGLDNTRRNLRYATRSQNQVNSIRTKSPKATSKYRGITLIPAKWIARIKIDDKVVHLGNFNSEEDAARAYDDAARKHYREFAELNFPSQETHNG